MQHPARCSPSRDFRDRPSPRLSRDFSLRPPQVHSKPRRILFRRRHSLSHPRRPQAQELLRRTSSSIRFNCPEGREPTAAAKTTTTTTALKRENHSTSKVKITHPETRRTMVGSIFRVSLIDTMSSFFRSTAFSAAELSSLMVRAHFCVAVTNLPELCVNQVNILRSSRPLPMRVLNTRLGLACVCHPV